MSQKLNYSTLTLYDEPAQMTIWAKKHSFLVEIEDGANTKFSMKISKTDAAILANYIGMILEKQTKAKK